MDGLLFVCVRLLAQLHETEIAFDDFWAKHQQKLEQCLQLRHFELDFKEVIISNTCGILHWLLHYLKAALNSTLLLILF